MTIRTVTDGNDKLPLLRGLLPKGPIWQAAPGGRLEAMLLTIGDELARLHNRVATLMDESDPRSASETLDAWERNFGLPDPDDPTPPTTDSDRQDALAAKVAGIGGQWIDYYIAVAAALGVTVTIDDRPYGDTFRVEEDTVETPLNEGVVMFYWEVTGPAATAAAVQARLEAIFDRLKPAHTIVVWSWTA